METKLIRDNPTARKNLDKVTTKHRRCPARVLKGGRCEKDCPFRGDNCPDDYGPHGDVIAIDHERLVSNGDKTFYIWHNHYQPEGEYLANLKSYCTFHALSFEIVQTKSPRNPSVTDWNVCVSLMDTEGTCQ